jgi:hypothetical protein
MKLFKTLTILAGLAGAASVDAQVVTGVQRGGSNFLVYKTDPCPPSSAPADRDAYGVIANYNTHTTEITNDLAAIQAAGQSKMRIPILHAHGATGGLVMNSTGGVLSAQNMTNLRNLLSNIKNHGITEVEIGFFPQGPNNPDNWTTYDSTMALENWNIINSVHQGVLNPGFNHIYWDLGNEMMTSSQSNNRYKYMKYIWPLYNGRYANYYDTVGFSFASGEAAAISNMGAIYGHQSYPVIADIHIYPYAGRTAGDILYSFAHNFATIGTTAGSYRYIIGEVNFNNATDAASLAAQYNALGAHDSKPWYLIQYPYDSGNPNCTVGDVSPFNNYEAHGF